MATTVNTVKIVLVAEDQTGAALTKVDKNLGHVGKTAANAGNLIRGQFRDVAGAFTTLVVVGRFANMLKGLVAPAMAAQDAMAVLKGTLQGTTTNFQALQAAATAAAAATKFSPVEAIEGMEKLAAEGIRSQEALEAAIGPAMRFAQASGVDVATAAKLAAVQMRELGADANGLNAIMEKTFFLSKAFGAEATELPKALRRLSESIAAGARDTDDLMLAVGRLTASGGSAARATTNLSNVYTRLASPATREAFRQTFGIAIDEKKARTEGLALLQDVIVPISEVMRADPSKITLVDAASKISKLLDMKVARAPQVLIETFLNGMQTMSGEIKTGTALYNDLIQSMTSSTMLMDIAERRLRTLSGAWEHLTVSVREAFLQTAAGPLVDALSSIVHGLAVASEAIVGFFNDANPVSRMLQGIVQAAFTLTAVFSGLVLAIAALAAVYKLLGVAKTFVLLQTGLLVKETAIETAAAATATTAVGAQATATAALATANVAATGTATGLGKALKYLGVAVTFLRGPLGILLTILGGLVYAFRDDIKAYLDLGGPGYAIPERNRKAAIQTGAMVARMLGDMETTLDVGGEALAGGADALRDAVKDISGATKQWFPKIDIGIVRRAEAKIAPLAELEGPRGKDARGLLLELQRIRARTAEGVTPKTTEALAWQTTMAQATAFMYMHKLIGGKKEVEKYLAVSEEIGKITSPASAHLRGLVDSIQALGEAADIAGVRVDEYGRAFVTKGRRMEDKPYTIEEARRARQPEFREGFGGWIADWLSPFKAAPKDPFDLHLTTTTNLTVDGKVMASIVAERETKRAARVFAPAKQ